jgi:hypothetical protein
MAANITCRFALFWYRAPTNCANLYTNNVSPMFRFWQWAIEFWWHFKIFIPKSLLPVVHKLDQLTNCSCYSLELLSNPLSSLLKAYPELHGTEYTNQNRGFSLTRRRYLLGHLQYLKNVYQPSCFARPKIFQLSYGYTCSFELIYTELKALQQYLHVHGRH